MRLRSLRSCFLLASIVSANMAMAADAQPQALPAAATFQSQIKSEGYGREDLFSFRALEQYQEPGWVSELVKQGRLPSVEERLPAQPLVYSARSMPDGIGDAACFPPIHFRSAKP